MWIRFQRFLEFLLRLAFILCRQRRFADELVDTIGVWGDRKKSFILPAGELSRRERHIVKRINVLRVGFQYLLQPLKRLLKFPLGKLCSRQNQTNRRILWVRAKMFFCQCRGLRILAAIEGFGALGHYS